VLAAYVLTHHKASIITMRLLLIEDDPLLGEGICRGLQHLGHSVDWVKSAEQGEPALQDHHYQNLILDLSLPGEDGLSLLRRLRQRGEILPVLILTARDTLSDRITGLDAGADDYLVKPFALAELDARLRALQRRHHGRAQTLIEYGKLRFDPAAYQVYWGNKEVHLSQKEFNLLHILLENINRVFSRSQLEEHLYGWNELVESNAVEVHIHHLRKKLDKHFIHTIRGVGYMLKD